MAMRINVGLAKRMVGERANLEERGVFKLDEAGISRTSGTTDLDETK